MEKEQFFQWSWNYKENTLNKDLKKKNIKKDIINLIGTNHQINMTSAHFVSSNNSVKAIWMLRVCAKDGDSASVSVARVMWTYKGDMNSTSQGNWKEPSLIDVPFNGFSNEKTHNINKNCLQ